MKKVIVLGGGMIGSVIAADLCNEYDVTIADKNSNRLSYLETQGKLKTTVWDFSDERDINKLIEDFNLVIGAVPGNIGFETLRAILSASKNVVDISFFERDPFELDELANEMDVTAVVDCGISPGLSNIILGFHNEWMEIESYKCYVGGLPFKKYWPFNYKATFSPIDVIQEYIRPARIVSNSKVIVKEALSDPEMIEFDEVGTLEAFNTDGLRTLLKTIKIPNMIEKTLRYPGHRELMKIFRETGFFSYDGINIGNQVIRPIDLTSRLLFSQWEAKDEDDEFTMLRIEISGKEGGEKKKYIYEIFDRYDKENKTTSMARTTGFTCTAVARLILEGNLKNKGILPPEYIGAIPGYKDKVLNMIKQKNITIRVSENMIPGD
jgi:saccharopine dehydrogenase-like NADP-dependent oxidoreductase